MNAVLNQASKPLNNLKDFLNSVASNQSELTKDRVKVELDEVITHFPNGVTITDFEITHSNEFDNDFTIFNFKENVSAYCFGGTVLTNVFKELIKACGSQEQANQLIKLQPCVFKFAKQASKDGSKTYYTVEIV